MEVCQSATCTVTSRLASLPTPCICNREARKIGDRSNGYRHPNESLLLPPGLERSPKREGRGVLRTIHQGILPPLSEAWEFGNLLTLPTIREDLTCAIRLTSSIDQINLYERRARVTRKYLGADGNPIPEWYERDLSVEESDKSAMYYIWEGSRLSLKQWRYVKYSLCEDALRCDEGIHKAITLLDSGEDVTLVGRLQCREVTDEGVKEAYASGYCDIIRIVEAVIHHWNDRKSLPWISNIE